MAYSSEIEKLEKRWLENPRGRNFAPLADAYRKAGEVDKAVELCLSGLERHPDYVSAHIVYGRCLVDKKNDVGADEVFRRVLTLDPENIIALKVLADLATRREAHDEAAEWLSRLLAADPMNDDAREALREARTKAAAKPPGLAVQIERAPDPMVAPQLAVSAEEPGLIDLDAGVGTAASAAPDTPPGPPAPPAPPIVEHEVVELQTGAPRASGIETFEDLALNTPAVPGPPGLVIEEEQPIAPASVNVDGLARTAYEGSGMLQLDAREEPPADEAPRADYAPTADLPLIMPDEEPTARSSGVLAAPGTSGPPRRTGRVSGDVPAAVALSDDDGAVDTAALSAAEPVVTETMAELYLQQGHREDALRVFHALLAQRPGDARLAARLRELEAPSAKAPPLESATAFLRRVWRGEPAPRAAPAHELSGALEAAFAAVTQTAHAAPVEESPGAPTHPAADSISLDSVFGDQLGRAPGAEPPTPPAAPQAAAPGAPGGFSFDDFFGATPNAAGGAGSAARSSRNSGPRPRSPQPEDEDLDQFQAWLKGLKA